MLNALINPTVWQEFLEYKSEHGHMNKKELQLWEQFISEKDYLPIGQAILQGSTFLPPRKSEISKMHSQKKRTVYIYSDTENRVLKLLTFLLQQKYDQLFAPNLYSFRRHKGVRDAITKLIRTPNIRQMWSYKVDISNYFNSIPVHSLLPLLHNTLADEPETYRFLASLLENPLVNDRGKLISEEKGIMAGTPISTFLANLYLSHMDHYFADNHVIYARYSDDIIFFCPTQEDLEEKIHILHEFLAKAGLTINPAKEARTAPGEMWVFLGICYLGGIVDVAPVSVEKLKGKMRRKARALKRWKDRKGKTPLQAAGAFIKVFNKKLFENPMEHELTWARWYFPLINTADSLREIDNYCQSCIRYLATGKHTKAAYNFRYEEMKELGYISVVNQYYKENAMRK